MKRKMPSAAAPPVLALLAPAVAKSPSINRRARVAPIANAVARVPARSPDSGHLRHRDASLFRRHPLIENPEISMKYLIRMLMRWTYSQSRPSVEERYLAQSVDTNEFEVRAQALERRRA